MLLTWYNRHFKLNSGEIIGGLKPVRIKTGM
jgi:hypothetical protein